MNTNDEHAEQYRLLQAKKILDVFREHNGRPAETIEEVERWVGSPAGKLALSEHRGAHGKIDPS